MSQIQNGRIVECKHPGCKIKVFSTKLMPRDYCGQHKSQHERPSHPCEIVGTIDPRQFARNVAEARRDRDNRRNAERAHNFMARTPLAESATTLGTALRDMCVVNAGIAESGRIRGQFITKATRAEAEATAAKLRLLGYGE